MSAMMQPLLFVSCSDSISLILIALRSPRSLGSFGLECLSVPSMLWRDLSGCTTLFLTSELSGRDAVDAAEDTCEVWLVGEAALFGYLRQKVEELQRKCHRILGCMK